MKQTLTHAVDFLDSTINPEIRRQEGMELLRGRILGLSCMLGITVCGTSLLFSIFSAQGKLQNSIFVWGILHGLLLISFNRMYRSNKVISAVALLSFAIGLSFSIYLQAQSPFAPGLLWYPVLMQPTFLLCERRLGLWVCFGIFLSGIASISLCLLNNRLIPFSGDVLLHSKAMLINVAFTNILTVLMVSIHAELFGDNEKKLIEYGQWLQKVARMQELLYMAQHYVSQTNGPVEILGKTLRELDIRMQTCESGHELAPLLLTIETSIQKFAKISHSFSLFSRRDLREGWEETTLNTVLKDVDVLFNVENESLQSRLHWTPCSPDVIITTQAARLVTLLLTILRSISAKGGIDLQVIVKPEPSPTLVFLRYRIEGSLQDNLSQNKLFHDLELTAGLIKEFCSDLGVICDESIEGNIHIYRLKLPQ